MRKKWVGKALIWTGALAAGIVGSWLYHRFSAPSFSPKPIYIPVRPTQLAQSATTNDLFVQASQKAMPSVVFIRAYGEVVASDDFWDFWSLWIPRRQSIYSAGSGVIISAEGYVVTNLHVIRNAQRIEVTLKNKHTYPAQVVGVDANTDLALLKISAPNLTPIEWGNSDATQIGEWVLALGNPYNLTYTVTAGIISARGRNINILNSPLPIESFIQTDAAINPGNSGGALVNLRGELIGINTAIASKTGAYVGYGFAIPSNIVRKVVEDIQKYGHTQRAFLDADVIDIDQTLADKIPDEDFSGVYVQSVIDKGAADKAGLQKGDILLKIQDHSIDNYAEYLERLSLYRPGDKIKITFKRNKKILETYATLNNEDGEPRPFKRTYYRSDLLGVDITPLTRNEAEKLGVKQGYKLVNFRSSRLSYVGLQEGYIILRINRYVPQSAEELAHILENTRGRIEIEGIDPEGRRSYFSFFSQ
ncbi:MAG: trypsin-like peptidase domain-containing protein [Bacteroidia bacterium]